MAYVFNYFFPSNNFIDFKRKLQSQYTELSENKLLHKQVYALYCEKDTLKDINLTMFCVDKPYSQMK